MSKQVIAMGGGGFSMEPKNPLLDLYVLSQSKKEKPRVCFLATASGDSPDYINFFLHTFSQYPCDPTYLGLMSPTVKDIPSFIGDCDIVYVGGGNSKTMLGIWKEWGVIEALKAAYENGTIMAGMSAGSVCWFEQCITDSFPGTIGVLNCSGFIKGSNCPHYDSQEERQAAYHQFLREGKIGEGYACDDGVALHFEDDNIKNIVSSRKKASAYYLSYDGKETKEEKIVPTYLGTDDDLFKYINSRF